MRQNFLFFFFIVISFVNDRVSMLVIVLVGSVSAQGVSMVSISLMIKSEAKEQQ
jgi:hypothetical protein